MLQRSTDIRFSIVRRKHAFFYNEDVIVFSNTLVKLIGNVYSVLFLLKQSCEILKLKIYKFLPSSITFSLPIHWSETPEINYARI